MIKAAMMEMPGSDEWFMRQAMKEARKALARGEVPIGAVVVRDGHVIARGWNQVETLKDATAHAEMIALTAAQEALGDWRLEGCTLYVTKEPCPMCAGAIVHCRPDRVVFGCPDAKTGAAGGWINLLDSNPPSTTGARCSPECWGRNACTICSNFSGRPACWPGRKGNRPENFPPPRRRMAGKPPNKPLCICQKGRLTAS